ncbi:CheR family methyltransferase [Methylocystis parvus]|uniref:CheR family methyltransferase n=1 Tax=Methylocystis parvus TaxID=134 RepID=UPI003C724AD8
MNFIFARFRRQLAALTGIALDADKLYLAESRLAPVMRAHGLADLAELVDAFERQENSTLVRDAIDAMTTNETLFFRDRTPFENFRKQILPDLIASRANERRLRFWCAACSTGQEAYSLAMTLDQDAVALRGWTLEVLATDLSTAAVEAARSGSYSQFEVQRGLSTSQLLRYFHREDESWRVNEHLRARIDFRDFNLLSDYTELGTFDVIFCRNVLMYFEPEMKRAVLARLSQALNDSGYLFLGAAEPTNEANAHFTQVTQDGVWRARRRTAPQLRLA